MKLRDRNFILVPRAFSATCHVVMPECDSKEKHEELWRIQCLFPRIITEAVLLLFTPKGKNLLGGGGEGGGGIYRAVIIQGNTTLESYERNKDIFPFKFLFTNILS